MTLFLSEHPYIDTGDVEETCAKLAIKDIGFDLAPRAASEDFHARLYCAQYPELHFASTVFHQEATLQFVEGRGEFAAMVPFRGRFRARSGQRQVTPQTGQLTIFSPDEPLALTQGEDCDRLTVYLSQGLIEEQLELMLGWTPQGPLFFDPSPDPVRNGGRFLKTLMDETLRPQEGSSFALPDEEEDYERFREALLEHMLLSLRHNYSQALAGLVPGGTLPADVKRVLEYIHAYPQRTPSLKRLVEVANVPGRTLIHHFNQFLQTSPVRYARDLRFERAKAELERAGTSHSVGEVARLWGFSHLGRFATEYRQRFGESPSDTLRKNWHFPRRRR